MSGLTYLIADAHSAGPGLNFTGLLYVVRGAWCLVNVKKMCRVGPKMVGKSIKIVKRGYQRPKILRKLTPESPEGIQKATKVEP